MQWRLIKTGGINFAGKKGVDSTSTRSIKIPGQPIPTIVLHPTSPSLWLGRGTVETLVQVFRPWTGEAITNRTTAATGGLSFRILFRIIDRWTIELKKNHFFLPSLPDNASISIYLTFNRLVLILMLENSVDIFKYAARSIFNCLQKKGGGGKKYEIQIILTSLRIILKWE